MKIHEIHDLSNQYVVDLMQSHLSTITDPDIIKNYHPDYSQESGNLFMILRQGRFYNGKLFVIEDNGEYVCSSGWNEYELEPTTALLLTRMYTNPRYRLHYNHAEYLLPKMIEETNHYRRQIMTVNKYNLALYRWFERGQDGKAQALFNNWPPVYKNFRPAGIETIYYTKQHVIEHIKE